MIVFHTQFIRSPEILNSRVKDKASPKLLLCLKSILKSVNIVCSKGDSYGT